MRCRYRHIIAKMPAATLSPQASLHLLKTCPHVTIYTALHSFSWGLEGRRVGTQPGGGLHRTVSGKSHSPLGLLGGWSSAGMPVGRHRKQQTQHKGLT